MPSAFLSAPVFALATFGALGTAGTLSHCGRISGSGAAATLDSAAMPASAGAASSVGGESSAASAGAASNAAISFPADASAPAPRETGPFELAFAARRNVYFTLPATTQKRLIANLHGMCNPPGYACGYWTSAAKEEGFLICPTGNATCGGGASAPPTWTEGTSAVDRDLEASIAVVDAAYPNEMSRDGAILTGFSRGAYLAPDIAAMHPGRWPYLILNEANVPLDAKRLRAAGVRAVAMIAGEYGSELAGERATVKRLKAAGFPAEMYVMPKAGHFYSANINDIMAQAITFVTKAEAD